MNITPMTMPKRRTDHAANVKPLNFDEKPDAAENTAFGTSQDETKDSERTVAASKSA